MKSRMPGDEKGRCYICGRIGATEVHHIFGGSNRSKSEKYGLKVNLCRACHNEPPNGVHFNRSIRHQLQEDAQAEFEKQYTREDWMALIGKNYRRNEG